jgi:signal transduction histidine kinase
MIAVMEAAGLVAALTALLWVWRGVGVRRRGARGSLSALLVLLSFNHLANVLETFGFGWADAIADHLAFGVPLLWGLFLFEIGREFLTARLSASDEQLRFFLEHAPASIAWLDAEGHFLGQSESWAQRVHPSPPGSALAASLPVPLPELSLAVRRCGLGEVDREHSEESAEGTDGTLRHFRWAVRRWTHPDKAEPGLLVILDDMTAEREAEARRLADAAELSRTQRLADVGQLAAGAAHDFNNFLQLMQAAVDELELDPQNSAEPLGHMRHALESAAAMTRAMLHFGKGDPTPPGPVDVRALVEEVQGPLAHALGRRHHLVVALPGSALVTIWGSRTRIQQALLNLAMNARDAMPRGGKIELSVVVEGNDVLLSVRDFGVGMPEAVKSKLFTPFFTTKGALGTGLGLRVVQSAVEEHRGQVSVESQPGVGTVFRLRIPLFEASGGVREGLA